MREGYIFVNDNVFTSLIAITADEQQRGLMHIQPPTPIMSFVYASPQINKFWMRSTPAPLDIIFCCDGKVSELCHGNPYDLSMIGSNKLSDLVIEFPEGSIDQHNIKINNKVGIVKPEPTELRKILAQRYYF